jgi:hypothetical protein
MAPVVVAEGRWSLMHFERAADLNFSCAALAD